ncbi:neuropeptide CCHamide-2 receptor [Drosophila navojoa]|uniref:neuropeptide CCHamide-2 receptor n=1 Tax=Drosophila navojoa TaxID=7232 RepID=UPI0011BDF25C|nr:neuropeptide CCHamide-2 receptor [Drosophila navojoa]
MYAALMDMSQMLAASLAYAPAEPSSAAAAAGVNLSQLSNSSQLDASSVVTVATAATVGQHNASGEESSYVKVLDRPETYIVTVLYTLIFIVGVLGNGTLVIIFFRHRSMRNIPNTYILSLALADLLVILVCVPVATIVYTQESWPFERNMCRISEFFKDISIGVSVFTLTALSGERYCAIVNPLRKLQTKPLTVFTAVIIWVFAIMLGMPSFVVSDIQSYNITTPNGNITIGVCSPFRSKIYANLKWVSKQSSVSLILSCYELKRASPVKREAAMVIDSLCALVCSNYSFLNSCVNPVALYCVSGVFRQHFNRYLCCICVKRQPHLRQHSTATGIMDTSVTSMRRSTYVGGGIGVGGAGGGGPRASVHMNNNHGVSGAAGGRGGSFHRQDSMALQHAGSINGHSHNANLGAGAGIGRASIINEKSFIQRYDERTRY